MQAKRRRGTTEGSNRRCLERHLDSMKGRRKEGRTRKANRPSEKEFVWPLRRKARGNTEPRTLRMRKYCSQHTCTQKTTRFPTGFSTVQPTNKHPKNEQIPQRKKPKRSTYLKLETNSSKAKYYDFTSSCYSRWNLKYILLEKINRQKRSTGIKSQSRCNEHVYNLTPLKHFWKVTLRCYWEKRFFTMIPTGIVLES